MKLRPAHCPNNLVGQGSGVVAGAGAAWAGVDAATMTFVGAASSTTADVGAQDAGPHAGIHMPHTGPKVTHDVPAGQHESGSGVPLKL